MEGFELRLSGGNHHLTGGSDPPAFISTFSESASAVEELSGLLDDTLPLTTHTVHLCVDMQKLFGPSGPWATPWMEKVLPVVVRLAEPDPARTIFTRFIPPHHPHEMPGNWQKYYRRWKTVTLAEMDASYLEFMPPLAPLVPPAIMVDKTRYSGFAGSGLEDELRRRGADGLIVTGSETDVCVLATVLDAVDAGYRVILLRDARLQLVRRRPRRAS